MKKLQFFIVISSTLLFLAIFSGCSQKTIEIEAKDTPGLKNPAIRIQVKRETPELKGATYGWGAQIYKIPKDRKTSIAAISKQITGSLSKQLAAKGMRYAEKDSDYIISFGIGTAGSIDEDEIDEVYLDLIGNRLNEETSELYYKQGVMIVDVVERKTKTLMWRGAIMAEIDMEWPEERKQERSDAVARELLKCYPHP